MPWTILRRESSARGTSYVMAAAQFDGIGVIAEWTLVDGFWQVRAIDTESAAPVTDFHAGEPVAPSPPIPFGEEEQPPTDD